ncbi:hypothetical protein [Dietzia kunjamensis]|uniref:hypothetical protein n=1 Tax=Dietzia kunjamensis TaxID=322509 RepID=UPI00388E1C53
MSDFEYVGDWNNQWNFKEKSTGMAYTYGRFDDDSFELDTGDRLIVTQANSGADARIGDTVSHAA